MKKLALAAVVASIGSAAYAGTPEVPYIEPEIIIEEASSSSSAGILVPLFLLILLAAATM
ncbi:MAG: hypothetical protein GY945_16625 [Rhodobacteraceae bacterium]|nr:hypothetical protein [Paracoccaceae bacterium]